MPEYIETNLEKIAFLAEKRENENYRFRTFLKGKDSEKTDKIVHEINDEISSQIDCTTCGNCCKTYMISLEKTDIARLSGFLGISDEECKNKYLEVSQEERTTIFNKIPCHFLCDNKCTVYSARPEDCRSYPHLHKDDFTSRLYGLIANYAVCPIVFNVFERLKDEMRFRR